MHPIDDNTIIKCPYYSYNLILFNITKENFVDFSMEAFIQASLSTFLDNNL